MGIEQASSGNRNPHPIDSNETARIPAVHSTPRPRRRVDLPVLRASFFQVSIASIGAVFLLATIGFAALGRETHPEGTIPPGVRIAGAGFGGIHIDDARDKLEQRLAGYAQEPLALAYEDQTWYPTMADLGAEFDIELTLQDAQFSRSHMDRVKERLFGVETTVVPLRMRTNREDLDRYIAGVAEEIDRAPEIPQLAMQNGGLVLTSSQTGIEVAQGDLADQVVSSLYSLERKTIDIPFVEIQPDFDDSDVESVRTLIEDALESAITITFEEQSWTIEPAQLSEFLTLQPADDGGFGLGFHEVQLLEYLDGLIGDIDRPAVDATIVWGGESVVATSPSQTGIERDLNSMIPVLEGAIGSGERHVELTYNVVRPAIDSNNLGELGITGLMSQGESVFWNSSSSRAHNIGVAAGYLDGTVIPPGTEFSFNQAVGEISSERGYQEGYVILAEETVPGVGGGVCQVSTTVFRAAFFSGLPITERHPHAYIIGFYEEGGWPLGFDAAIFQPHVDFKFVNSTDSYMLMHTHVVDQKLYVNLYGPDLGYDVTLGEAIIQGKQDPPDDVEVLDESLAPGARQQVEWAKPGVEVTLPRTVTKNGEVVRTDYFYSNFQPWGNRFLVGPSPETPAVDPEDAPIPDEPSGEIIEEDELTPETEDDADSG
jgi:vancomycin resistance protein YoaR